MKHNCANDSAFPSFAELNGKEVVGSDGLTTREYFAGQALIGLMANSDLPDLMKSGWAPNKAAEICFMVADAMLAEAAKSNQPRNPKET